MPVFVEIDRNGMVAAVSVQSRRPAAMYEVIPPNRLSNPATQVACKVIPEPHVLATMMRDAQNTLVPRPNMGRSTWDAAAATVTIPQAPAGTVIELHDLIGQEIIWAGPADHLAKTTITITDPGSYEIEVTPPVPYLEHSLRFDHG